MKNATKTGINNGFTIIETLIVLAISGFILLGAIILVNGRQNTSAFNSAIHDTQSKIEQVINDASNGYYPNNSDFSCTNGVIAAPIPGRGQGHNQGCLFLGNALQFAVTTTPASPEQFETHTLIGTQLTGGGQEVSTYLQANPKVPVLGGAVLSSAATSLENGLTVASMQYCDTLSHCYQTGGVAFLGSLATYSGGGNNVLSSGAQQMYLIPLGIDGTQTVSLHETTNAAATAINSGAAALATYADKFVPGYTPPHAQPTEVDICFASGNTNQSGLISINSGINGTENSGQLAVSLTIKEGLVC